MVERKILGCLRCGDKQIEVARMDDKLYIIRSVLDISDVPIVRDVIEISIPDFGEMPPEKLLEVFRSVMSLSYPLPSQLSFYNTAQDDIKAVLGDACRRSKCLCDLWWTFGCFELCSSTDIEKLLNGKVVKFFTSQLSSVYGYDEIVRLISETIGKMIQIRKGEMVI
jgi:hypothetical protein